MLFRSGSGALCDKYREIDKRVHVIHQENQGMLPARYNGLRCLECDYATFVDADDWIETDTYEKMSPYMEQEIPAGIGSKIQGLKTAHIKIITKHTLPQLPQ